MPRSPSATRSLLLRIPPGNYAAFTITDAGAGLDAEKSERIFEPFQDAMPGNPGGLEMAMVHGFIRQSGGSIEARNLPDGGTEIRIYLPLWRTGN